MNKNSLRKKIRKAIKNAPTEPEADYHIQRVEEVNVEGGTVKADIGFFPSDIEEATEEAEFFRSVEDDDYVQLEEYAGKDPDNEVSVGTPRDYRDLLEVAYAIRAEILGHECSGTSAWNRFINRDYDFTCVLISKDTDEFEKTSTQIRQKYSNIIADWKALLILKVHKFEHYDLLQPFDSSEKKQKK